MEVARDDMIKADLRIGKDSVQRNEPDIEARVSLATVVLISLV